MKINNRVIEHDNGERILINASVDITKVCVPVNVVIETAVEQTTDNIYCITDPTNPMVSAYVDSTTNKFTDATTAGVTLFVKNGVKTLVRLEKENNVILVPKKGYMTFRKKTTGGFTLDYTRTLPANVLDATYVSDNDPTSSDVLTTGKTMWLNQKSFELFLYQGIDSSSGTDLQHYIGNKGGCSIKSYLPVFTGSVTKDKLNKVILKTDTVFQVTGATSSSGKDIVKYEVKALNKKVTIRPCDKNGNIKYSSSEYFIVHYSEELETGVDVEVTAIDGLYKSKITVALGDYDLSGITYRGKGWNTNTEFDEKIGIETQLTSSVTIVENTSNQIKLTDQVLFRTKGFLYTTDSSDYGKLKEFSFDDTNHTVAYTKEIILSDNVGELKASNTIRVGNNVFIVTTTDILKLTIDTTGAIDNSSKVITNKLNSEEPINVFLLNGNIHIVYNQEILKLELDSNGDVTNVSGKIYLSYSGVKYVSHYNKRVIISTSTTDYIYPITNDGLDLVLVTNKPIITELSGVVPNNEIILNTSSGVIYRSVNTSQTSVKAFIRDLNSFDARTVVVSGTSTTPVDTDLVTMPMLFTDGTVHIKSFVTTGTINTMISKTINVGKLWEYPYES